MQRKPRSRESYWGFWIKLSGLVMIPISLKPAKLPFIVSAERS